MIHLLATVSEDRSAMHGIRFICRFFESKESLRLTLLYLARETDDPTCEALGVGAVEDATRLLRDNGLRPDQVEPRISRCKELRAEDIARESDRGGFDAVVLGKRGLSWLETALGESMSEDLLREKACHPMWVCRAMEEDRRDVLVCVDGSPQSLRILAHAAAMAAAGGDHRLTLLHVSSPFIQDRTVENEIFDRAFNALETHGFPQRRAHARVVESEDTVRAILKQAAQGRYAAVAVGRTGSGETGGRLKRLLMGSISMGLLRELTGAALWVCR